jgi:NADPH:quinone reductase-like Zn-dependent oxidoreductase
VGSLAPYDPGMLAIIALVAASIGILSQPATSNPPQPPAATMKAVRYHASGGPEVLKYEDAPKPEPKANEVLIKVHAAGVNPIDWKLRSGRIGTGGMKFPITPGYDASGVVESVGGEVKDIKAGDEVYTFVGLSRSGAYAEYAVARGVDVAKKPKSIDHAHAAGVPLAALTAWQALFDKAELEAGQTVLIHAGAGGVGHFAVQFAKAKGAKVIATASAGNQAFLKELGADQAIDYKTQKFEEIVKDVDVALDAVGGETLERTYGVLKKGGALVSIAGTLDAGKVKAGEIKGSRMLVAPSGKQLAEIAELIDAGKVKPHVGATFKLEEAAKAHEASETGHARGKTVLIVQ